MLLAFLNSIKGMCISLLLLALPAGLLAQSGMIYSDLNGLEGIALHPENVLSYKIINNSGKTIPVRVRGMLSLKSRPIRLQYEINKTLYPGENTFSEGEKKSVNWMSNEPALKSLFLTHGNLPQGTFEYCVDLQPQGTGNEQGATEAESSCIYYTQDDLFAINLIDPEDKAVVYEKYPVFSWVASYPFASELTYRIRVAEQKPGQNPANAIARNNPMWQDNQLSATTAIYPVTGRPLEYGQPYVWTVDAYYKGLLLGGAETWRFMLVEDSLLKDLPRETSYIDVNKDKGINKYYLVGNMKLKYSEKEFVKNQVTISILRKGKPVLSKSILWDIKRGDNFFEYDLNKANIRHSQELEIVVEFSNAGEGYFKKIVKAIYINPDYVQ